MKDRFDRQPQGSSEVSARLSAIKRVESVYSSNRKLMQDTETILNFLPEKEYTVLWHFFVARADDYIEILNEKLNIERN